MSGVFGDLDAAKIWLSSSFFIYTVLTRKIGRSMILWISFQSWSLDSLPIVDFAIVCHLFFVGFHGNNNCDSWPGHDAPKLLQEASYWPFPWPRCMGGGLGASTCLPRVGEVDQGSQTQLITIDFVPSWKAFTRNLLQSGKHDDFSSTWVYSNDLGMSGICTSRIFQERKRQPEYPGWISTSWHPGRTLMEVVNLLSRCVSRASWRCLRKMIVWLYDQAWNRLATQIDPPKPDLYHVLPWNEWVGRWFVDIWKL